MNARIVHIKSRQEWGGDDPRIVSLFTGKEWPDYDTSEIYRAEAETDRIQQLVRLNRKEQWQYRVTVGCILVAGFTGCYFVLEFLR